MKGPVNRNNRGGLTRRILKKIIEGGGQTSLSKLLLYIYTSTPNDTDIQASI